MEDYGMHISPDSWSSGSSLEGILPLDELTAWVESALEMELSNKTGDTSEAVSSSDSEEKQHFAVPRNQDGNISATLHDPSTAPEKPKGKARVVFTERQLNSLVHHFNLKHYHDPSEMKQLAEMTGLTYKQVKTWFQNRRSKFRRSSHPQHVNQGVPLHFQGERQSPLMNFMRINNQAHYPHAVALPQWTFPNSPQMFGWSMPPGNGQYEFNPVVLNTGM